MTIMIVMYITKEKINTYMISARIQDLLINAIRKHKKIEGLSDLSKFSTVPISTIKTHVNYLEHHDNIIPSRIGSRKKHIFEYREKTDKKSTEYNIVISNYSKIVNLTNNFIENHLKKMKKLKLLENQLVGSSELAGEIFVDIDKICEKLTSLKCKTRKNTPRYDALEIKISQLHKLKPKLHENVYRANPLLESRLMNYLGSARIDKKRLRNIHY